MKFLRALVSAGLVLASGLGFAQAPAFNPASHFPNGGSGATRVLASIVDQVDDGGSSRFSIQFNEDSHPDIAVLDTGASSVTIGFGNGTGTNFDFQLLALTASVTPFDIAVGQLSGDTHPDLAIAEGTAIEVYASASALPGGFAAPVSYAAPAGVSLKKIVVADWNGDGSKDVIAAGTAGTGINTTVHVAVYLNNGTGLDAAVDFTIQGPERSVSGLAVADVDGDDRPDIVFCDDSNMSWVHLLGRAGGTLETNGSGNVVSHRHDTSSTGFSPRALAVGDVTGDGSRDVVLFGVGYDSTGQALDRASVQLWLGGASFANFPSNRYPLISQMSSGLPDIQGDVAIANVAGDFRAEIIAANYLPGRVSVLQGPFVFSNDPADAQPPFGFEVGDSPRRIAVGDLNDDGFQDVVSANGNVTNQLSVLLNSEGGPTVTIPPGRVIQFGDVPAATHEDSTISIPVVRGSDSTGQVIAYFSVGGTAVQQIGGNKNPDYEITEPSGGLQSLNFADGEHVKEIKVNVLSSKTAENVETIELQLLTPWGDAELGDPISQTIYILDGKATVLKKPGGLGIKPGSSVKTPAATLKQKGVKAVARTHSNWNFTVSQAFPKGASNIGVRVQTSLTAPPAASWTDLIELTQGKGASWSGHTATLPIGDHVYFRTVSSATGFPVLEGLPSPAYEIIPGPDIFFSARQMTGLTQPDLVPYDTGTYVDDTITYRFRYSNVAGATSAPATNLEITTPIPMHTAFQVATTAGGAATLKLIPNTTKPKLVQWQISSLAPGESGFVDLVVQVDPASAFARNGDPLKAIGTEIIASKYFLTSAEGGRAEADRDQLKSVVHGPIELQVDRDSSFNQVAGGDAITYTLRARNTSGNAVTGALVRDRVPLGTVLDTVYVPDANGNSTNTPLPNSSSQSNPKLVYVLLADAKFLHLKKGAEVDVAVLDRNFLNQLLDAGLLGQEVQWPIGVLPAHGQVDLKFSVRVIYDAASETSASPLRAIVNDGYDFTIPAGTNTSVSALYGQAPARESLTSTVLSTPPASKPVIGLNKSAIGARTLNNPNFSGNGSESIAGFNQVTTAVKNHGLDYELHYENTGTATAHQVVMHDVIPAGTLLRGFFTQEVNGGSPGSMNAGQFVYYDAAGNVLPNVTGANIHLVRSMDIRLSQVDVLTPLAPGASGTIRYTVEPIAAAAPRGKPPTLIHSFGGYEPSLRRSDPQQGAYISTVDLQNVVPATPSDLVVKMVGNVSWDLTYTRAATEWDAGSLLPFDFEYTQNGDNDAANTHIDFQVPLGTTVISTGPDAPKFTDGLGGAIGVTFSNGTAQINVGTSAAGEKRKLRLVLRVADPLPPALAVMPPPKIVIEYPKIVGTPVGLSPLRALLGTGGSNSFHRLSVSEPTAESTATMLQPVDKHVPSGPKLSVGRNSPYTVGKGQSFDYQISVSNHGDTAATNVTVGMQVPYYTRFVTTGNGIVNESSLGRLTATPNPIPYTTTPRNAQQVKGTGAGPDVVTWHFAELPAHATCVIALEVRANSDVSDLGIRDHSLYASASNAASAYLCANPIGTWIVGKTFDTSKWEVLGTFCDGIGIPIDKSDVSTMRSVVDALTRNAKVQVYGGLDVLELTNGAKIFPLGNNQVLVISSDIVAQGGGNIVAQGGGNIVAQGGGNIVAQGAGNAISIGNVAGLGTKDCAYLLDHALDLVNSHAGNIVASGAGNLITNDGGSFTLRSNQLGGAALAILPKSVSLLSLGANIVAQGGGNVAASGAGKLITNDGGSLISQDGAGFLSNVGGSISFYGSGRVISNDGASLITNDGGSIVAQGGGN